MRWTFLSSIRGSCSPIGVSRRRGHNLRSRRTTRRGPFLSAALRPRLAKSERLSVELGGKGRNGDFDPFPPPRLNGRYPFDLPTRRSEGGRIRRKLPYRLGLKMAALDRLRPPLKVIRRRTHRCRNWPATDRRH